MYIRIRPHTKNVKAFGYRQARVIPVLTINADYRNEKETEELNWFHEELCKRANVQKDNHQSFVLDDNIIIRFDDYTILVGLASEAEIKSYSWW